MSDAKTPWWDRLSVDRRDRAAMRAAADAELMEKVRDPTTGVFRNGMMKEQTPLCISEPYQDDGKSAVMSRHRGRQLGITVPKKGRGTSEGYVLSQIGVVPLCVGDNYVEDAGALQARQESRARMWPDRKAFRGGGTVKHNTRSDLGAGVHCNTDWYLSEVDCNVPNDKVQALAKTRIRPVVKEVFDVENNSKGFFIGQPTRKGTYGMPGTTFGEQFGGPSGEVYKYTAEPSTELALRAQARAESAYARKQRGERPGFRPASGHADSGKQIYALHMSSNNDRNQLPYDDPANKAKYLGRRPQSAAPIMVGGGTVELPPEIAVREDTTSVKGERKAFRPNGDLPKGNAVFSSIAKFPRHKADPYPDVMKADGHHVFMNKGRRVVKASDDRKKWRPGSSSKYIPSTSIALNRSNIASRLR